MKYTVKHFWYWTLILTIGLIAEISYNTWTLWDQYLPDVSLEAAKITFQQSFIYVMIFALIANIIHNVKELYNNVSDEVSLQELKENLELQITKLRIELSTDEK